MRRLAIVALAGLAACSAEAGPPAPAPGLTRAGSAAEVTVTTTADAGWDRAVAGLAQRRTALAKAWREAPDPAARALVRELASRVLVTALRDELAPPWLGMPWGMGRDSTATRPYQPDHTISCSYFVGALLQGAGWKLHDRFALGQAAALVIQKSLSPGKVYRYYSIPPAELAGKIAALGDGVYLIGLDIHVGLVVVRGGEVRFVHASYTGDRVVTDEPLAAAQAIASSQPKGYFVSPLVTVTGHDDDWLVERWLAGDEVGPGA